jgi:hypothetical protein
MSDARPFLPPEGSRSVQFGGRNGAVGVELAGMIEASRTLMKSEPELADLVGGLDGVEVAMAEKGFGTRVEIRAAEDSGLEIADLERLLDDLGQPQKQPFGSA